MKQLINALIVDDTPLYANRIARVMQERNNIQKKFEYHPVIFKGEGCFNSAKEHIKIMGQDVDLAFSDFNLGSGGDGIDLFKLFHQQHLRPFKILHSNTSKRLNEHSEEFKNNLFDAFSRTKDETEIKERLISYEENILTIKKYGNPNFYPHFYKEEFEVKKIAEEKVGPARLIDIVSINTEDDNNKYIYRDFEQGRIMYKEFERKGADYRLGAILETAEGLSFARFNQSQLVNLLWVSKINASEKKVTIISPDTKPHTIQLYKLSDGKAFLPTYEKYLSELSTNLSNYFI